ncbi:MAG: DUF1585 domain-containing protein, partial [Planctomycetes bacterium]|nr:DUF1585 domain-containing protein [Planctomycetota bacterium]
VAPLPAELHAGMTTRERVTLQTQPQACVTCHGMINPLGFSLENFDAVGAWRDRDGSFAIDASGRLPGGATFQGPGELKALLVTKKEAFCRCLAEKLLTYALGRGVEDYDQEAVNRICRTAAQNNYRFSSLILAVIQSDPFLKRGGK